MAIEKFKILGLFWSYQLDTDDNSANLPQKLTKLAKSAKLAVLFSW